MKNCAIRLAIGLLLCLGTGFSVISGQEPTAPEPPSAPEYVPGEVLVRYRPESTRAKRDQMMKAKGARVLRRLDAVDVDRVQLPKGLEVAAAVAGWQTDSDILSVEPNYLSRVTNLADDPYWLTGKLWGMTKIRADAAWLLTLGGNDVVVADFDTGVNYLHPDLAANMWKNPGEIPGNNKDDDANGYVDDVYGIDTANNDSDPMDDHGHGTHTAGTIGAVGGNLTGVVGVAWNVKILTCKFISSGGSGSDSNAMECFNYIVALKKKGVNIRVSSNSWGRLRGTALPATSLKNAIDAAGNVGIVNVFASGNSGVDSDTKPFDPASFTSPSIVSVAASTSADGKASFSNYGAVSVDLAAPGVGINSTTKGGGYGSMSGTSMAAPHVAGAAALLSSLKPALTVSGIKSLMMNSVDQLPAWDGVVASGGRLNVFIAALDGQIDIPPTVSLTLPLGGTAFTAPATTTVAAVAADADGTVSKVDFFANGTLIGTDTTSPYSVSWANVAAGSYNLSAMATDNRQFTTISAPVAVAVAGTSTPAPPPSSGESRVNQALATAGARISASSTYSATYTTANAINGNRRATLWKNTWADKTSNVYPDWLRIDFDGSQTIDEINVFTGQGNGSVDPTPTQTSTNALADFQVQYLKGTVWTAIPGGIVTGNQLVWRRFAFSALTTTAIRVYITRSGNALSRIAEVEAFGPTTSSTSLIGFPADNWWNLDVSSAPVDPSSASYISFINNGSVRTLHPDFGGHASPGSIQIYGMPYVVVDSTVSKKAVQFYYSSESDGVNHATNVSFPFYPIPDSAITQPHMIEGGSPGNVNVSGDRHLLIVDRDARHLYELYNVFFDGTKWTASSGAFFDMNTNDRRPDGWTSADAAGLAILPGLVRHDEAFGTEEIRHAFRVTVRATNGYVFPASHRAGSTAGALPMGARLRLKSSKDLSTFPPELQRIFRAMKRHGLIVADNGSDMYVSGAFDARWSNDILNPAFRALKASDFEVIRLGHQ